MEWREEASCKDMPTSIFFDGWFDLTKNEKKSIVEMCVLCPVRRQCYNYAVKSQSHGVWAGKDFKNGRPYNPFSPRKHDPVDFDQMQPV